MHDARCTLRDDDDDDNTPDLPHIPVNKNLQDQLRIFREDGILFDMVSVVSLSIVLGLKDGYLGCRQIVSSMRLPYSGISLTSMYDSEDVLGSCVPKYLMLVGPHIFIEEV